MAWTHTGVLLAGRLDASQLLKNHMVKAWIHHDVLAVLLGATFGHVLVLSFAVMMNYMLSCRHRNTGTRTHSKHTYMSKQYAQTHLGKHPASAFSITFPHPPLFPI